MSCTQLYTLCTPRRKFFQQNLERYPVPSIRYKAGTDALLPVLDVLELTVAAGTNQKSASTAFRNNRNISVERFAGMNSPNKVRYHRLYRHQKPVRTGFY